MYGAIELGGTKIVCAVGTGPDDIQARCRIPTGHPDDSLRSCLDFFSQWLSAGLRGLGIASFGPLHLDPSQSEYGRIAATPKPGWAGTDLLGFFAQALELPVAVDTDVNAAALAEARWGAGRGADPVVYVTVGTGIGGGAVVNGRPLHGLGHPEMGHMRVGRLAEDTFAGVCPFHGDCLEGLCAGPAIAARCGRDAASVPQDDPVWALIAAYLGRFATNLILTLAPQRLIFGGGTMQQPTLIELLRQAYLDELGAYLPQPLSQQAERLIVLPALGQDAGLHGGFILAESSTGYGALGSTAR